jgi:PAS domain S-box-containing protein
MLHRDGVSAEWCHVTLASIGDGVITTRTDGAITFLNAIAESLTGWTLNEAVGQPLENVFRIVNEQTRRPVANPALQALRDGVVIALADHTLLIAKDGTERPIDERAAPIRNAHSEVRGAVLVFRDVSERRLAEQRVQDALAHADNIISTLRDPFVVLDKTLHVRTANAAFYSTFNVAREDTEGRFICELGNHQWDIPQLRNSLEEVLPQNRPFNDFSVEHNFPSIGEKIMLLNARRLATANGESELILLAIEDVTEPRRAERTMRTSEARYRRLFETAKDGILILDVDSGRIVDANPFMTQLLGYTHAEFEGKELWEIGVFSDKSENEAAFRRLQQNGYVRYEHLALETKKGERAEVEFVSNVYQVGPRRVAQCNIRDTTERMRLQRQTQEQATELSDLHRRKDEFLAMLSHELRNPLAPILNAVQLLRLQQANENPVQLHARAIIERQVAQLAHLVDDLLEVARITTGRVRLQLEQVAVSGIVANAVETTRPLIDQRNQQLTISVPPEPIWLHADAARLEQILVNLLTNACRYTDEGGHIWLTVLADGDACLIRVRDTGVGIAPELLPRIFDLFTQANRHIDRAHGGLGIGLTLVKRLTELHGGTVHVSSAIGKGSKFLVRLPKLKELGTQLPLGLGEADRPTALSFRVLIVEDNVDAAESLAMLVKAAGYDVRTIHNGQAALKVAQDYLPHAVLLDIGLPGLNGYEVAKWIRAQPNLASTLLIALTGYGQDGDRQTSLAAGFNHHLVKPASFKTIRQVLATLSPTTDVKPTAA